MVSIIVPYKNPLPYFEDCLRSIVNQSYQKLQIILVNDNSTDDSEKLKSEPKTSLRFLCSFASLFSCNCSKFIVYKPR